MNNKLAAVANPKYPAPTMREPTVEELNFWFFDGVVEATDGCTVEPDGVCEHGHPSWFLHYSFI